MGEGRDSGVTEKMQVLEIFLTVLRHKIATS